MTANGATKRGRPKKADEKKRTVKIDFACTVEEKELLRKWAAEDGAKKLSEWLREQVGLRGD